LGLRRNAASDRTCAQGPHEFRTDSPASAGIEFDSKEKIVKLRCTLIAAAVFMAGSFVQGQQVEPTAPRTLNLHDAVEMALKHNHVVRISSMHVEEEEHAKEVARSAYLPTIKNASTYGHATDTQFIGIPAGSLGVVGNNLIPSRQMTILQGDINYILSGTELDQPLTQLFKIKSANDAARADLNASREKARGVENDVALKVREVYYDVLVVQSKRQAIEANIRAVEDQQSERVQQVKYGSTLEVDLIETKAQLLQAKQDLLTTELQLSDLKLKFNDIVGLPLWTDLTLDPDVPAPAASCQREQCIKAALDSHPEITEARAEVEKASAGVRVAKREYIPDIEAYARYNYQENVPFFARNFGTFGVRFSYDVFDGGKRRATIKERDAQLEQAKENLARISDEVQVRVQTAYNKLERTQQMVAVSQELLATRQEARRVAAQQLKEGTYLRSQADAAAAQEFEAQTLLLQSQLEYAQAQNELTNAVGETAE
jgi:outer membrane protein TolC